MAPIDLHLVSWNRPKMTKLVIEAINRNTKKENYYLTVLDNGSGMEVKHMLLDMHDKGLVDEIHAMPENRGLEAARQFMLERSTYGEFFVCIDNDCLPPPMVEGKDWIERMVELMQKYEDYAAISMRTQVMIGTGNIFEEADALGEDIVDFPHPGGSYRIMRSDAVNAVGGWDRGDPGRGSEERYICGKLRDAGYKTAFASQLRCLHLFGTRGDNPTDRWGYDKDWQPEDTGHSDISHPALTNGDDLEEIKLFAGDENADSYYTK